ncbi:hypothetical protein [Dyadobacter psychrotolerans]|uniref:Uncharacterized protein n=1 Tax=Dyadobacter psychrotolerans TaxID=2541721 RepID=A0A4R5E0K6_9BACT|nr:hypothetical protein [Dyadobacter psychrotolerans]TDE17305.1 hypothetical protein E0F88_05280 [Dyadobacter psychrotolerans]
MKLSNKQNLLISLLGFLSLGAMFGGGVLIISPTGKLIGMPLSILAASPFHDFLIPGILLFIVLGIFPMLLIFALSGKVESPLAERFNIFQDMIWSWSFCIYQAFALIIWIQLEMVFLHAVHWLHTFYMFYAIVMLLVALLPQVRDLYKNR